MEDKSLAASLSSNGLRDGRHGDGQLRQHGD
jgi:hypothetical protein